MRPARLNEICGYKPIYDPSKYRALVRPFLDAIAPPDVVGIMLEYVHDDVTIAQMSDNLMQRLMAVRAQWVREIYCAIGAHVIRLGVRMHEDEHAPQGSFGSIKILRMAEDEWGNLHIYVCRSGGGRLKIVPITEKDVTNGFKEVLNAPATIRMGEAHLSMHAKGAYVDEWGSLWIDGVAG
jgi:hypothetical protein